MWHLIISHRLLSNLQLLICVCFERERETYNDPFEVDNGLVSFLIMEENGMCKLRNIMPGIAFSSNIKFTILILRKSFQPIQQKHIIISCSSSITTRTIILCCVGVRKSYPSRRLKEQNICGWRENSNK